MKKMLFAVTAIILLTACVRAPIPAMKPEEAMSPVSWRKAALLADDMELKDMSAALRQSLEYYQKIPAETQFVFGPDRLTALDLTVTLQNFLLIIENDSLTLEQKMHRIREDFLIYRASGFNGKGTVLFTGYYEPTLSCRVAADSVFRYPLYRRPDDIIEIELSQFGNGLPKTRLFGRLEGKKMVPYYSREDIDQKKMLAGKGLEILWCSDLVDIYNLQVQGSGKVDLGDGNILSVLYDGQNGKPYRSIGKYLVDTGLMTRDKVSMQAIREYLRSNPDKLSDVLNQNQSYVFFRLDTGPSLGNIGVALTPNRSIATDSRLFPKGALAFIYSQKPVIENGMIKEWAPFTRFVVNQDSGGAIKGAGRVDLFYGRDNSAELAAGNLQHEGELYFLVRKKNKTDSR